MGVIFAGRRAKNKVVARAIAVGSAIALSLATITIFQSPAEAVTQTYTYTGGPQIYVVPENVTSINVTLNGAQGGNTSGGNGGKGATVGASVAVNPGEVLMIMVGGNGTVNRGWNGGGIGAGFGGGATDIRREGGTFSTVSSCAYQLVCTVNDRIVVAGGGGGSGWASGVPGGANGGDAGQNGLSGAAANIPNGTAVAGGGGTQIAGGTAGSGTFYSPGQGASAGALGVGANSAWVANATGGGGGGGYYGGGSGGVSQDSSPQRDGAAGGGGGSSWAGGSGVSSAVFTSGSTTGDGSVVIDPPSAITDAAFGFTGAPQFYTVSANTSQLYMRIYGAGGSHAAPGDIVYGRVPVTGGQVLQINIGGQGYSDTTWNPGHAAGEGGWNGGGNDLTNRGWGAGSGGGGGTDIRSCNNPSAQNFCSLTDRLIVAGGGGGGSYGGWGLNPGAGGSGADGSGGNGGGGLFGLGGTLTDGGGTMTSAPPLSNEDATSGTLGQGGNSGHPFYGGGAGGGGFYGGGGGNGSGGGGGSSCASITGPCSVTTNVLGLTNAQIGHSQGFGSSGDGMAVITAMPVATTGTITNLTSSTASVDGTINAKFLASTPKLFLGTNQATIQSCDSVSAPCTANSAVLRTASLATRVAGTNTQNVAGSITGLAPNTTYYYRVCAQSVAGYSCGVTSTFTTELSITNNALASGTVGQALTDALAASGGSGTYSSWALANGTSLPAGLSLNSATGAISGAPTTAGSGSFDVTVVDSLAASVTKTITYLIASAPAPSPSPTAASSPPTSVGPQATNIWPNTTTVSGGNTVTLSGSNLAGATVFVGNLPATVVGSTNLTVTFTVPSGLSGQNDIQIVTPTGSLVWQDAITVKSSAVENSPKPTAETTRSKTIIFDFFAPGSPTLTAPHLAKLPKTAKASIGYKTMYCAGFTMGPTVLRSDRSLAMARATNVCDALHKLSPTLIVVESTAATQKVVGGAVRRVEVTFSK